MSETPATTGGPDEANGGHARTFTRNRERHSCAECRRRKLRCDRGTPCGSCVRRGEGSSCSYQRFSQRAIRTTEELRKAESRLNHLEQLIETLAAQATRASRSTGDPTVPTANGDRQTMSDASCLEDAVLYSGSSHWSAMLDDIRELRFALPAADEVPPVSVTDVQADESGIGILLGASPTLSLAAILDETLPPRREVDRMVSTYFRSSAVAVPFLHAPRFMKFYQEFWKNPAGSPALWLSILFSICHVSTKCLRIVNETHVTGDGFSVAAARCLSLGEYFRPKKFSVEALLVFVHTRILTSTKITPEIGVLMGLVMRLATTMGYHRDPDVFDMSPFEGEMRRRVWSMCLQLDLMISFHLGLPSGIQFPTWDTRVPKNLNDADIHEDAATLPSERPWSEVTQLSLYKAKHSLMVVFEKILRHTLSTHHDDSQTDVLDAEMQMVFASLPEPMWPRPLNEAITDLGSLITIRLCLSFLYYKCLCALHRPYVTKHRSESIVACYKASSGMVALFLEHLPEFRPGGQLETESWFLSSITWHDFLYGLIALCLILCEVTQNPASPAVDSERILSLLQQARVVCAEPMVRKHEDMPRMCRIIDSVVNRFQSPRTALEDGPPSLSPCSSATAVGSVNAAQVSDPKLSVAMLNLSPDDAEGFWDFHDEMDVGMGGHQDPAWNYLSRFLDIPDEGMAMDMNYDMGVPS